MSSASAVGVAAETVAGLFAPADDELNWSPTQVNQSMSFELWKLKQTKKKKKQKQKSPTKYQGQTRLDLPICDGVLSDIINDSESCADLSRRRRLAVSSSLSTYFIRDERSLLCDSYKC